MFYAAHRAVRAAIGVSAIAVMVASAPIVQAQKATGPAQPSNGVTPNYELAAAWTTQKVSRLVFDTSVTPRWLETSDRFWYSYNTREGRRFMLVDPIKKTKTPLFDHAKMAAALTMITRIPYDAQHLPFTQVRFIKSDAAFEFDVQVPRDAVIPTTRPKAITTDQQGGAAVGTSRRTNSTWSRIRCSRCSSNSNSSSKARAVAERLPVQAGARRRRARRRCTSSTTWRPQRRRWSRTIPRSRAVQPGAPCHRMGRPCCSRAITTST
jgi:hypothetical protein